MLKALLIPLLSCGLVFASPAVLAQSTSAPDNLPRFEVATIKPPNSHGGRVAGFSGKPGGRIFFGGKIQWLIQIAFNLQDFQLEGDKSGIENQWFEINAIPPADSPSRKISVANAEPTPEQRLMLQSLLRDRFGFKYHLETKKGNVYFLTRGKKPLQFKPPAHPESDPRAIVFMYQGGIVNGEAMGNNTTMDYLAQRLSQYLQLPVLNRTGIKGAWDFNLKADDPQNHDMTTETLRVVDRLGLKLRKGRGPIQTLYVDHLQQPSPN